MTDFSELLGKTLVNIEGEAGEDLLTFTTSDGERYQQHHDQDCCESVRVEEIVGDLSDLIGSPILQAEDVTYDDEHPPEVQAHQEPERHFDESFTWTFYKLATIKGSVTIRWLGESNGYYSESVDFAKLAS